MEWRFITNLPKEEMIIYDIAVKASGIKEYTFCKEAIDKLGNTLSDCYSLYFYKEVTKKEIELYHTAFLMIKEKLRRKEFLYEL